MPVLNQILAIEKGIKSQAYADATILFRLLAKSDLFNGMSKTYQSKDEDGEAIPPQSKRVQHRVDQVLADVAHTVKPWYNVTAKKDWTNCDARASVVVGDHVLIVDVPVTFLLFLEKQLTDLRTIVDSIPVLSADADWDFDANQGLYVAPEVKTHRTKKVQKAIVKYPATEHHPAQTEMITDDVIAGFWTQVDQSGAMTGPDKRVLAERVETLLQAVKQARETANAIQVAEDVPDVGRLIFDYLLPR